MKWNFKKIMKNVLLNMKDVKYNSHSMLSYSLRYNLDKSLLTNQLINNIIRRFFYRLIKGKMYLLIIRLRDIENQIKHYIKYLVSIKIL